MCCEKQYNRNENQRNKYTNNIQFKINVNLRNRLNQSLQGNYKSERTLRLLGCSIPILKAWLEFQFYDGMVWDHYGTYFHIDRLEIQLEKLIISWSR